MSGGAIGQARGSVVEPALRLWLHVARIDWMMIAGIRELKNHLSRYVRRVERGERVAVTAHGRVVAELSRPAGGGQDDPLADLIAKGLARPALEEGDPLERWPSLRLPAGTAAALLDADRGDA